MAPSKYLLHVNSRPASVSNGLWKEWYVKEHLPDLVGHKSSTRATFYEEVGWPSNPHPNNSRKYLALYQSDFEELLKSDEYKKNGDFDARYYSLWQDYDPNEIGEKPSPYILTVYMNREDSDDFERWYREEHLDLLSKLPGYRRSLRYKIGPDTGLNKTETLPFLAIHEVEHTTEAFGSKEAKAANTTPWTLKHIEQSHPFIARAWKRISAEGY